MQLLFSEIREDYQQSDEETKKVYRKIGWVVLLTIFQKVKKADSGVGRFAREAEGVAREVFDGK